MFYVLPCCFSVICPYRDPTCIQDKVVHIVVLGVQKESTLHLQLCINWESTEVRKASWSITCVTILVLDL